MDIVKAWKQWVRGNGRDEGSINRRKLVVQIISVQKLSRSWQSYENAVLNFTSLGAPPSFATQAIEEAAKVGGTFLWDVAKIREFLA